MADPAGKSAVGEGAQRFLTFHVDRRLYALPADEIAEVIRVPSVARLPQGPKSLLGVANLRGAVLPLASLRALLGRQEAESSPNARAIVLDGDAPVALAVDDVDALVTLEADQVETRQAQLAADDGERLRGAFKANAGSDVAKILDIKSLLDAEFVQRARPSRVPTTTAGLGPSRQIGEDSAPQQMLVTFAVAGQEYALSLDRVQEILPAPTNLAIVPRAEALVLGVTAFRDTLLPLLSLRGLLGFAEADPSGGLQKVLVTPVSGVLVGLVADGVRSIVRADPQCIDPTPPVLAARAGGETRIKAILRADGGRRLISILDPDLLFREDVMQRLASADTGKVLSVQEAGVGKDESQFLVFRLGEEEFGLPIACIDEVARAPDEVTRVPKTPTFLEGVINLRGEVLPVVDQRKRFDLPAFTGERQRQRLVVVRTERHRAGLIVDSVSEVLRTVTDRIEPAPDMTGDSARLVGGVVNFGDSGRMVLLLDPAELLSRAERNVLDKFDGAKASP